MVLKTTFQKECPEQSLFKIGVFRNFPIFAGKLCWSLTTVRLCCVDYCEIFTKSFFDRKSPVASVDLLFLIKSNVGWFLLKRVDLVMVRVIYTLSVETIPTRFYWLTCRNQELVQSKLPQQRLFVLILGFWQCRHVLCKLTRGYIKEVI